MHRTQPQKVGVAAVATAGIVVGVIQVVIALSFAALVFSGPLAGSVAAGSGVVLVGGIVTLLTIALGSSRPGSAGATQDVPNALLATGAAAIAARVASPEAALATTFALMAVAALGCGVAFVLAGWLRLGRLIRFLPYSVVGGFLAGTGIVLVRGGLDVAASPVSGWLAGVGDPDQFGPWALALVMAVGIHFLFRTSSSVWILPGVVALFLAGFHLVRLATGQSLTASAEQGWVFESTLSGALWRPFGGASLGAVDVDALLSQTPLVLALIVLSGVALLLQVSGIEVMVGEDLDLDRELRAAGLANLGTAVVGGLPGYHAMAFSALNERAGVRQRWGMFIAGAVSLVVVAGGGFAIGLVPRFVLGGVLVLIGVGFLEDWVIKVRSRVTTREYGVILGIALVVATWGFLPAILVGLVAAVGLFVHTYSTVEIVRSATSLEDLHSTVDRPEADAHVRRAAGRSVPVFELEGYLFFGSAARVVEQVMQAAPEGEDLIAVVLDMDRVTGLDSSAVQSFVRLAQFAGSRGAQLLLSGADPVVIVATAEMSSGADEPLVLVFSELDRALEHAEELLLDRHRRAPTATPSARSILAGLVKSSDVADELSKLLEVHRLEPGETLVARGGESVRGIDLIVAGHLDVGDEGGRLRRLGPGSVLGEVSYLTDGPPSATVVATTKVELHRLAASELLKLRRERPDVALVLERALGRVAAERLGDVLRTLDAVRR